MSDNLGYKAPFLNNSGMIQLQPTTQNMVDEKEKNASFFAIDHLHIVFDDHLWNFSLYILC